MRSELTHTHTQNNQSVRVNARARRGFNFTSHTLVQMYDCFKRMFLCVYAVCVCVCVHVFLLWFATNTPAELKRIHTHARARTQMGKTMLGFIMCLLAAAAQLTLCMFFAEFIMLRMPAHDACVHIQTNGGARDACAHINMLYVGCVHVWCVQ